MDEKGLYYVCEGVDGTGKSTLTKDLGLHYAALTTRMPGGSEFAERLRGECRNADISDVSQVLFFSALNLDCMEKTIRPAVDAGKMIISDRGFGSTFSYQAYPGGCERLLQGILEHSPSLVVPDLTLYIDVEMEVAYAREAAQDRVDVQDRYSQFDRIHKEKIKESYDRLYIRQTRTNHLPHCFDREVTTWKIRDKVTKAIEVIDGNQPYDKVLQDCKDAIDKHMKK